MWFFGLVAIIVAIVLSLSGWSKVKRALWGESKDQEREMPWIDFFLGGIMIALAAVLVFVGVIMIFPA